MLLDSLFHAQSGLVKKTALLFNIPCAILPMLIALGAFLSLPEEWAYFQYDAIIALSIYLLYGYGLHLSYLYHRKSWPAIVFLVHLGFISIHFVWPPQEWSGYAAVISLIGTSLVNQYHRMGSLECLECGVSDA